MRNNMRLRTKMTFWYTAFTFFVIAVFCVFLYWVVSNELQRNLQNEATMAMSQLVSQIENENGMITFENEVPVAQNIMFYITEDNGSEIASYGKDITVFDHVPIHENEYFTVKSAGSDWLLLDSSLIQEDSFALRVRVAVSYEHKQQVLSILLLLFFIGVPSMTMISLLGGFGIAKRSLMPIRKIITSAEVISQGNLSERVPATRTKDELGELTDALNGMLASVEAAFIREKQFSSDASHELRTPVTVVRAYTETLLKEPALTVEQRESFQIILTECTRMEKIISQLLLITRGQEKRYPVCIEAIKLKDVVDSVAETINDPLQEKSMKLVLHCSASTEVQADQSLFTQMLLNLLENGIKYGKEKGTITLSVKQNEEATILSVKDNGIGIPEEALPHIFDRFYRVDASRTRNGSGLGLSIVKWIVETHQGTIDVHSKLGHGTEFIISVPKLLH